jgi:hypothetical protein
MNADDLAGCCTARLSIGNRGRCCRQFVPSAANGAGQLLPAGELREANREDISHSAGIFVLRTLAMVSGVALARPLLGPGCC